MGPTTRAAASARRSHIVMIVTTAALLVPAGAPSPSASAAVGSLPDFDGDRIGDLAIGIPAEAVGGETGAGAVQVLYGSSEGTGTRDQIVTQATDGIRGGAQADDGFGTSLTAGDFDRDGFSDLAVGVPGEGVEGVGSAGAVAVIHGSRTGLGTRDALITQASPGIQGSTEEFELFGIALASGDLDGDGTDDLAVGAIGGVAGVAAAGSVNVIFGGSGGLGSRDLLLSQATPGIAGVPEEGDVFGLALATGDLDGDGTADLAVGAPGEGVGGDGGAGAVSVIYGDADGPGPRDRFLTQDSEGIKGSAQSGEAFGSALAIGDVDDDGTGDLAVGTPGEGIDGVASAGAVSVVFGTDDGLGTRDRFISQNTDGIRGTAQEFDLLGVSLAIGDFDDDGTDDLAAGAPGEGSGGTAFIGAVNVVFGSSDGLGSRDQLLSQDADGIRGSGQFGDSFGTAVAGGDLDGDGTDDLAVGVPGETVGGVGGAGAVTIVFGGEGGLGPRDRLLSQDSDGIRGSAQAGDGFGSSLQV